MPKMAASRHFDSDNGPFWIGDSRVESGLCQITTKGKTHPIEQQVMRVLLILASHAEQPVTREAIIESVWTDSVPNDEGLTQAICKLRKVLGDRPSEGRIIQTIRKVGYRLVAPVAHTRVSPLHFTIPLSVSTMRQDNPTRRSIRIRVDGNWIAAAALLSMTIFFVSQTL